MIKYVRKSLMCTPLLNPLVHFKKSLELAHVPTTCDDSAHVDVLIIHINCPSLLYDHVMEEHTSRHDLHMPLSLLSPHCPILNLVDSKTFHIKCIKIGDLY